MFIVPPAAACSVSRDSPAASSPSTRATSASATVVAISRCTAKMSSMRRSKVCDQRLKPLSPSIKSAATRTTSPERRTLPDSR